MVGVKIGEAIISLRARTGTTWQEFPRAPDSLLLLLLLLCGVPLIRLPTLLRIKQCAFGPGLWYKQELVSISSVH